MVVYRIEVTENEMELLAETAEECLEAKAKKGSAGVVQRGGWMPKTILLCAAYCNRNWDKVEELMWEYCRSPTFRRRLDKEKNRR